MSFCSMPGGLLLSWEHMASTDRSQSPCITVTRGKTARMLEREGLLSFCLIGTWSFASPGWSVVLSSLSCGNPYAVCKDSLRIFWFTEHLWVLPKVGNAYCLHVISTIQIIFMGEIDWRFSRRPGCTQKGHSSSPKTRNMLGRASNHLGPGPWELFSEPLGSGEGPQLLF